MSNSSSCRVILGGTAWTLLVVLALLDTEVDCQGLGAGAGVEVSTEKDGIGERGASLWKKEVIV